MSTARTIAKNTSVIFIANIIGYIVGFFTVMYTARYLGADNFGILSVALSFTGIFGVISDLGLGSLTTREVARDKSLLNKYVGNTIIIKTVLAIFTLLLIFLIVNLIGYPQQIINAIYIIAVTIIIGVFSGISSSIFQAYEKMEYQAISIILSSVLVLLGSLFVIYQGFNVIAFAFVYLSVSLALSGYSFIVYSLKFGLPKIDIDLNFWKPLIKEALPFGLTGISGMIYTYIDSLLLSIIKGNEAVGFYSAAYRIMLVLLFVPNAVNVAIFPPMSRLYGSSSRSSLRLMHEKYFKFMIITGIPLGVGTTLLADKIILLIFGIGYKQSIIALQILIWTMVFTFVGAAFVRVFEATNKQLIVTKISGFCVVVNILLNLVLIPKFSYIGASVATVLTEIILVTSIFGISYKVGFGIRFKKILDNVLKIIFASLFMSIFILYFKNMNLLILAPLSTLVYFATLYVVRGIDDEDIYIIKQVLVK